MRTTPTLSTIQSQETEEPRKIRIVIIGAGFSGLSTAYHLMKEQQQHCYRVDDGDHNKNSDSCHFEIIIVEARDRIGGRVHPYRMKANTRVDLGGEWVHEACIENPIRQLMQNELKLDFVPRQPSSSASSDLNNVLFDQDGSLMEVSIQKATTRLFHKAMNEYEPDDIDITPTTSYQDLLQTCLELERKSDTRLNELDQAAIQRTLKYLIHETEDYEGGKFSQLSASLSGLYKNMGGPDLVPQGTYGSVLEALQDRIQTLRDHYPCHTCNIRLQTEVTKIEYGKKEGVQVTVTSTRNNTDTPTTIRKTTETIPCDYCVCTVPLGVLKQDKIEFVPPLSSQRQKAIQSVGMGLINKIVLQFECSKFWIHPILGQPLQLFGMAHDDPTQIKYYYDCSDDVNYGTSNENTTAILIQFLAGDAADRLEYVDSDGNLKEGVSDELAVEESLNALRKMFGADRVPAPIATKVTRWRQDPFSCGAYSFIQVGSTLGMYQELASPLNNCLLFAGEHTSDHAASTVHGAWSTGRREAERILEYSRT